ncbi:hypothetical protein BDQ17DRAFT_1362901 [Cyathus striatus]|nr:hypothetical protein BDQ17DRAFT_1362901 [Cyathus striatus]
MPNLVGTTRICPSEKPGMNVEVSGCCCQSSNESCTRKIEVRLSRWRIRTFRRYQPRPRDISIE